MNIRGNIILVILIIFLAIITPFVAAESYGSFTDMVSSDDGTYTLKTAEGSIFSLFNNRNNLTAWTYDIHGNIWSIAISPDNKYIAVGSSGGLIWLFDQKGTVIWNKTFGNAGIKSIEFSKDSQYLDASSFMNQAFYISIQGNRATRPISTTISEVPSVAPELPAAQIPVGVDLSWIESLFSSNLILVLGIITGLCIAGITWYRGTRRQYDKCRSTGSIAGIITLKNFTIFSMLLVAAGGMLILNYPKDYNAISNTLIVAGIAGLFIAYYLFTVIFWGNDDKLVATLMFAIPLGLYYVSTTRIAGSQNPVLSILLIFVTYAVIAAILLFISDKIRISYNSLVRSKRVRNYDIPPDPSYILPGIVIISLIMVSMGSTAILSENAGNILKSTTDITAGSQPITEPVQYTITPNQQLNLYTLTPITTTPAFTPVPTTIKNYETGLTSRSFTYVLRGQTAIVTANLYSGVYNDLKSTEPSFYGDYREYYLKYLDNPVQKKYLADLVSSIKSRTSNKDDQARIAINLVQQIPYDYEQYYESESSSAADSRRTRSPYETLYDNKGVCGEKSLLLAYLLRDLGYGVVLFSFSTEKHMAVGIKSSDQYAYRNSGYSFVESTTPTIVTDSDGEYVGAGKLTSTPQVIHISDGNSFVSISEEYDDARAYYQSYNEITEMSNHYGTVVNEYQYNQWMSLYNQWNSLARKYGMKVSTSSTSQSSLPSDSVSQYYSGQCKNVPGGFCPTDTDCCERLGHCFPKCKSGTRDPQSCLCM